MNLKLDLKIALKYSLFFSVFLLLLKINSHLSLDENYFETATPFTLAYYLYEPLLAILLVKSYLEYLKYKKNYLDFVLISFLILYLINLFKFLIDFSFFKLFYESLPIKSEEGILGLFNRSFTVMRPQFDFFQHVIISPFQYLLNALMVGDLLRVLSIMRNAVFIIFIVLYQFNLFFLFKKYSQNKWYSLIPVLNKLTLLKIAEKPVLWIILVFIPFVRYFFLYSINKKIAEENGFDSKLAFGMTFLPPVFYGKVSFAENTISEQN